MRKDSAKIAHVLLAFFTSNHKGHKSIIYLPVLVAIGVVLLLIISKHLEVQNKLSSTPFLSTATKNSDRINDLTVKLITTEKQYTQAPRQQKIPSVSQPTLSQTIETAKQRQKSLLNLLETNPQEFINKTTLIAKKDTFSDEVKQYIEQIVEKQGKLIVIHVDHFDIQKSEYRYFLEEENFIKRYELHFVKNPPQVLTGSVVKLKGVALDEHIALESSNNPKDQYTLEVISQASIPKALGEQKTAILMINFDDNPDEKPFTKEYLQNLVFSNTNPASVNNFYKENSFNKIFFTGNILGWYSVTFTIPSCNDYDWVHQAKQKAAANGINLSNYKRLVYAFASDHNCGYRAYATIGGEPSESWIYYHTDFVYAHELGHNLGAAHASTLQCGAKAIDDYAKCTQTEYGEPFEVMAVRYDHFNGPHKVQVGWVSGINLKEVTEDGIYTIVPLESSSSAIQVLQIPKPDTNEYYFVSYRQKIGFDDNLEDGTTNGASIHIRTNDPLFYYENSKLIDNHPDINDPWQFNDAALNDGEVFYDPFNKILIEQLNHTTIDNGVGSVTVKVTFNAQPPTPTPVSSGSPSPRPS